MNNILRPRFWLVLCLLFGFLPTAMQACETCSCGGGQIGLGIITGSNQHYLGIRYVQQRYPGMSSDLLNFQTIDIRFRYALNERWQLVGALPYVIRTEEINEVVTTNDDWAEPTLSVLFKVFDTSDSIMANVRHRLTLGAGAKLPWRNRQFSEGAALRNSEQNLGTGTLDYLFTASYALNWARWGLVSTGNYRVNGTSDTNYRYGNWLNVQLSGLRIFYTDKLRWVSQAGINYEHQNRDVSNGFFRQQTGGTGVFATANVDVFLDKLNIGAAIQAPLGNSNWYQNRFGLRSEIHLHYFF